MSLMATTTSLQEPLKTGVSSGWRRQLKRIIKYALIMMVITLTVGAYHQLKPLPQGLNYASPVHYAVGAQLLFDVTQGTNHEQRIFAEVFKHIDQAGKYILIDMFLFNGFATAAYTNLSAELTQRLIEKKRQRPGIQIDLITDPINTAYGGFTPEHLVALRQNGINLILTDLTRLRDSNPLYSMFWRAYLQWVPNRGHVLRHPFDGARKTTPQSYLTLLNFKANHRKIFVADFKDTYVSIITSANPHDGSSAHSNIAFKTFGALARSILESERAVAAFSGSVLSYDIPPLPEAQSAEEVQLLTENRISEELVKAIDDTTAGDKISLAMFYLSDRRIIRALDQADARRVSIRMILDPNRDAFGYQKNGIPNKPVAWELKRLDIRWYPTQGEQFHTKAVGIEKANGLSTLFLGSANLTKRNLGNFNLETDVKITCGPGGLMDDFKAYYERIWKTGQEYDTLKDESSLKYWTYRLQEATGMCTF